MAAATLDAKKAAAALAAVRQQEVELSERIGTYLRVLDPFSTENERRFVSQDEILEAQAYLPDLKTQHAKVRLELNRLERDAETARLAEREAYRRECIASERADVAELNKLLQAAIVVNERLRAKQQKRHEQTGEFVERASWMTLSTEQGAYYDNWLRLCRSNGLLD